MQQESETYDSDCDNSTNNEDMSHIQSVCLKIGQKSDIIQIHKFDLSTFCTNPSICMIGKRGSGKTLVMKELLSYMYKSKMIDECVIISPTDRMSAQYNQIADNIYYSYDDKIVEELLEIQRHRINESEKTGKKPKNVVIVLDDCLSHKGNWARSQAMQELFFNSRCYRITLLLTMQFPLGLSPELRSNIDYIFLSSDDFISNIKRIYDHYAGMFPTFDSFRQVFSQITNDFGFMTIINTGIHSSTLLDKVKWYKSTNLQDITKIPVTNLKIYNELLKLETSSTMKINKFIPEIRKKIEEQSCEFSDAESIPSYNPSYKKDPDMESVVSAKNDRLENLLLSISICNNNICKLVTDKSVADNRIDILKNIVNSNTLIINFLSNE